MERRYLLISLPGLEEVVAEEARRRGLKVLDVRPHGVPARVVVEGPVRAVRSMRTIESASLILAEAEARGRRAKDLRRPIREALRGCELLRELAEGCRTASVRCFAPNLDADELERIASRELARVIQGLGIFPDAGDLRLRVEVYGDGHLVVGLEVTGFRPLHRRPYTIFLHPAMLNPVIAAAMAILSGAREGELVCDPFCGAGTIPIEFALMTKTRAVAADLSPIYAKGAAENAKAAGVGDLVSVVAADFREPPVRRPVDILAADPPRGRREASMEPSDLFREFFRAWSPLLHEGSRVLIATPFRDVVLREAGRHGLALRRELQTIQGGMRIHLLMLSPGGGG